MEPNRIRNLFQGRATNNGNSNPNNQPIESFAGGEASGLAIQQPNVIRITVYRNGFTLNDEEFKPISIPENREFLETVKRSDVPEALRDVAVKSGGNLSVALVDKTNQDYDAAPSSQRKHASKDHVFTGSGQTLSSEIPKPLSDLIKPGPPPREPDPSKPMTTIAFRFHDGSRTHRNFNTCENLEAVHTYVDSVRPAQSYTLLSGYPLKPLPAERRITIESAGKKRLDLSTCDFSTLQCYCNAETTLVNRLQQGNQWPS